MGAAPGQGTVEEQVMDIPEPPPLPEGFEFASAAQDPAGTMARVAETLRETDDRGHDIPLIEPPQSDVVSLPGGLLHEGEVYREVRVRELTGEDEEHLARAFASDNPGRYMQTLLERGTVMVGAHRATPEMLDAMLIGDRDAIVLGIRRATYGDDLLIDVVCQQCGVEAKIKVLLGEEIPVKPLPWDAHEAVHSVALRKVSARVRLATGADQRHVLGLKNATVADMNTEMLARCVVEIGDEPVTGKQAVRALGMADRKTILDWMLENQPGPLYDKVKYACTACGKETPLGLDAGDLFPRWD